MNDAPTPRSHRLLIALIAVIALVAVAWVGLARLRSAREAARLAALPGAQTLATGFGDVERNYYEPISAATLLLGGEKGAAAYLHAHGIAKPAPIAIAPTGDPVLDGEHLADALDAAFRLDAPHLKKASQRELVDAALGGILAAPHDPYTVYLPPRQWKQLDESLSGGDFGGIGVYIFQLRDGRILLQPLPGLAASKAGLTYPAILSSVDGKSVAHVATDIVQRWIRGPKGSTVRLQIAPFNKPTQKRELSIVRNIVIVPTVYSQTIDGFGYIHLSEFGANSAHEMRKALLALKAKHVKGYILDLRDNGGGLVEQAVKIVSNFVPSGPIVFTIDRNGTKVESEATGDAIAGLTPLVILVNKFTASAAEITTGALQDYHLATAIGTRTYGKGVVQQLYLLPQGGALKITVARYVTPLNRDINHKGLQPDIVVDQPVDIPFGSPQDKQLQAALARLKALTRSNKR